MRDRGVNFVRTNMSHSTLDDLRYFITLSKTVGLPFIVDTEGSQIRNNRLEGGVIVFKENDEVRLYGDDGEKTLGNRDRIFLRPREIIAQLDEGDILYMDFDALIVRITDVSRKGDGYVTARMLSPGCLGSNKGVALDSSLGRPYVLPVLSPKDYASIELGLKENVGYVAASFMRSGDSVEEVRRATQGRMKIISKIECRDGLENLDDIINRSDFILIDRGDLSKEVPLEEIPILQKKIIERSRKFGKGVFVATNLLETMGEKKKPTRAEICDVANCIAQGAYGLTLAAETAVGRYPIECVNVLRTMITRMSSEENDALIAPHGGKLVNRIAPAIPDSGHLISLKKLEIPETIAMDVEQIAVGSFSPLEGFMGKRDVQSVLDTMRLADGTAWPLPIVLDVSEHEAGGFREGEDLALSYRGSIVAILHLEEKFSFNKSEMMSKIYNTENLAHPGVQMIAAMQPVFLGGKISLLRRPAYKNSAYALTPLQVRRIFKERHWLRIAGFHTRNVIHRSHEFIQRSAMKQEHCDGLFVHPVIGKKKPGDYDAEYIIRGYERMVNGIYPENFAVFATFNTYSRYAGPREALFTAICRQNFGCSHFIIGRDHTGAEDFYHPTASHKIFDRFPDIGIRVIMFDEVFYSKKLGDYVHSRECPVFDPEDRLRISGTEARHMFARGEVPPDWFMRPEISEIITGALSKGERVFIT